jgi:hypothetical protein
MGRITKKFNFQRGASTILLGILILSVLLVIGLGISLLMSKQIKVSGQVGQSVVAFYAAEAGAERCLYLVRKVDGGVDYSLSGTLDFNSNAQYTTQYLAGSDTITSSGQFGSASRKLEVKW